MKYIKVFPATNAYDLQCYVKEYEQNTKHIPVNQSCSVSKIQQNMSPTSDEVYLQ